MGEETLTLQLPWKGCNSLTSTEVREERLRNKIDSNVDWPLTALLLVMIFAFLAHNFPNTHTNSISSQLYFIYVAPNHSTSCVKVPYMFIGNKVKTPIINGPL